MSIYIVKVMDNGYTAWFLDGIRHRKDGPAITYSDGNKEWYQNDKLHREDGPAIECTNGFKKWYQNGGCHREDGPAVEFVDGSKEWWLNGEQLTEKEFNKRVTIKKDCNNCKHLNMSYLICGWQGKLPLPLLNCLKTLQWRQDCLTSDSNQEECECWELEQ